MTHNELLARINYLDEIKDKWNGEELATALRAVVELHKPWENWYEGNDEITDCKECSDLISDSVSYPCDTIKAIEKELG